MDTILFLTTWLCGVIIVGSVGFLTYVSMESWRNKPQGKLPCFCVFATVALFTSITSFAYMITTSTFVVDALMYTAGFHMVLNLLVAWRLRCLFRTIER